MTTGTCSIRALNEAKDRSSPLHAGPKGSTTEGTTSCCMRHAEMVV